MNFFSCISHCDSNLRVVFLDSLEGSVASFMLDLVREFCGHSADATFEDRGVCEKGNMPGLNKLW